MRTLTSLFENSKAQENIESHQKESAVIQDNIENRKLEKESPAFMTETVQEEIRPLKRTVIQAPVLVEKSDWHGSDEILIKAQPTANGNQCLFVVNRPLFAGYSWWFPTFESAEGSPLAEALFCLDGVESVLVDHSTVTVAPVNKNRVDWKTLAREVGAAIRKLMQSGSPLISEKIVKEMPAEEKIREDIQEIIDTEVNPGVSGHGGKITLLNVKGNTVTVQMGGGCQGCSSADATLKIGIHNSFRKAVPAVGAIYDETDHSAGSNPYY
ncbi:MAG: hypothetical protein A3K09_00450 [Nitrospinae bacterium RIFCSPLOWO2_12_FULL_47_7]|nr:MAG: hypothetical protein A3K09_00450 [Nitrospinae bacterium RIFCSPLOWO2_12_FULL_47_7]